MRWRKKTRTWDIGRPVYYELHDGKDYIGGVSYDRGRCRWYWHAISHNSLWDNSTYQSAVEAKEACVEYVHKRRKEMDQPRTWDCKVTAHYRIRFRSTEREAKDVALRRAERLLPSAYSIEVGPPFRTVEEQDQEGI